MELLQLSNRFLCLVIGLANVACSYVSMCFGHRLFTTQANCTLPSYAVYKYIFLCILLARNQWEVNTNICLFSARDCLALMQEGTELTKIKQNGRLYRRYYWLEDDEIRWMPTSKKYNKAKSEPSTSQQYYRAKNKCTELVSCL